MREVWMFGDLLGDLRGGLLRGCRSASRLAVVTSRASRGPLLGSVLLFVAVGCGSDRPALPGPVGSGPPSAPVSGARTLKGSAPVGGAFDADAESRAPGAELPGDPAVGVADHSGLDADPNPTNDTAVEVEEADEETGSSSAESAITDKENDADRGDVGSPLASASTTAASRIDPKVPEERDEPAEAMGNPEAAEGASRAGSSAGAGDVSEERGAIETGVDDAYRAAESDEDDATIPDDTEDPAAVARREAEEAAAAALLEALSAVEDDEPARVPTVDHASLDAILRATVRGDRVDYKALKRDHAGRLRVYLDQLAEVDDRALGWEEERLAFYINLYNASMFQAVLDRDTEGWTPAADSFRVFEDKVVRLKGRQVSLNHLENEIIREDFEEPRIHVALVCAARSCPTIRDRAYDPRTLDETLDENMRGFLASGFRNRVDRRSRKLLLSHIFDWYADDFGGKDKVAAYVDRYVSGDVSAYAVEFIEYQWELNAAR